MKKYLLFVLLLSFFLVGCNQNSVKGEFDMSGTITEVDKESNRILVEDKELGLVWLSIPEDSDIQSFEKGQNVAVWTDGNIRESYPLQATALNIEVLK